MVDTNNYIIQVELKTKEMNRETALQINKNNLDLLWCCCF